MNKNLFKTFAIAAMAVLAGACAKEQVGPGDGETTEVSFNVEVPGVSVATKGISDAASVDELVFQAFLYRKYKDAETNKDVAEYIPVPELTKVVPVADKKANVTASLVKGQMYSFIFWAQKRGTGYYNVNTNEPSAIDLRTITLNYANVKTNDALLDAFYAVIDIKSILTIKPNVTLKRALAQINFGSEQSNRQDAKVSQSSITLKNVPTTFHPLLAGTRSACDNFSEENIVLSYNDVMREKLSVNSVNYDYLATTYVFAPKNDPILVDASAVFKFETGKTTNVKVPNVSVKQNFRTNIVGNLLLANAEWNVIINPDFQSGDIAYDDVSAGLAKGTTVTLSEDYKVLKDNWAGINIPAGVESVLNLNGHRFANEDNGKTADAKSALVVKGKLTINGDGEVFCEGNTTRKSNVTTQPSNTCISVMEGGHLIINGGNYSVGTDVDTKCNSTIYVENVGKAGKVEIFGGTFTNAQDFNGHHSFVLNQDDQLTEKCITVYGGTFIGFNPADNTSDGAHTNYVADGYKSVKISESPDTWQVVDASVSVADQAEFEKTLSDLSGTDDVIIKLGTGNFEFKKSGYAGNITLKGAGIGKTVVTANTFYENKGVTISLENLTFDSKNPYVGDAQLCQFLRSDIVFTNCEINGVVGVMAQKSATFTGCTFKNSTNSGFTGYSIIYYGYNNSTVTVDDCKFETTGKAICLYGTAGIYNLVVKDCEFLTSNKDKAAIQIHTDYTNGDAASTLMRGNVNITNTTVSGFNGIWWEGLNDKTSKVPTKYFTITIDGTTDQTAE